MIIDGNKITADEGKLLLRKADNLLFGKELTLGYTWYINGELQNPPHLEVPDDYRDSDYIEVDGTAVAVDGFDYAYLKDRIVKLRYSPEDQIAIICNRELDVENAEYRRKWEEMQAWRVKAGEVAKEWSERRAVTGVEPDRRE